MNTKMDQFPAINPNPVLSVYKDGTVIYSNEASEPLLQDWGAEIEGKQPSSIRDLVQRVISLNSSEKMEFKLGKKVYLLAFHPVPEEECVNIYGFDISEQKELEEKLRESEKKYRDIVETANEGVWVTDAENKTTYFNQKMTGMLGYSQEEMIGKFVLDFVDKEYATYTKMKMEKRRHGIDEIHENKLTRKDGSPLWVLVNAKSLFDKDGKFTGVLAMLTDITQRKQVEKELREGDERYRAFFNTSAVGTVEIDLAGRFTKVNDRFCQITDYSREELLGMNLVELSHPDDCDYDNKTLADYVNGRTPTLDIEKRYVRKDGRVIWVEVTAAIVRDSEGKPLRSMGVVQDITERKKAEETLKKAHDSLEVKVKERTAELEEAQRMAHVGNWVWDIATDKAYWSDELYHIFRRNIHESAPSYDEYLSYVHPDDRKETDNSHKEALNGKPFSMDHRIILANGVVRTIHVKTEVIFDEENVPIRLKGTVQDITERKKSEEKIRYLANIVESSNDAIGTISLDGIFTSWNKGAEHVYGYSAKEILGKKASILVPSHSDKEHKMLIERVKHGEGVRNYETRRLRKDGKTIDVSLDLSPVFEAYGKLTAISVIARDITERKKAEEEIQNLANIVESSNDAIITKSLEGIITSWNKGAEQIYGYSSGEILGRPASILETDSHKGEIGQFGEMIKQGKNIHNYETSRLRKDGTVIDVSITLSPVFDSYGKLVAISAITRDITESKKAEQALANIEIARKKEIHHRIKNNLQVISSLLDLQAEQFSNRECINDFEVLRAFRESQDRVTSMALIHEELYRGEENDKLDFSSYIEELADNLFLTYKVGNKDISLNMDLEGKTFFDIDTAIPLGIIINELVSNSFKYAFKGRDKGEIRIKLHRKECNNASFILTISDNGVGIPKYLDIENLDSLGIQLVTTLIEQLDGELELKRENGTEFVIRFTVEENSNPSEPAA